MNILKQEYTLVLTAARHGQSATVAWLPGQQGTGRTVDARERHPSQTQATLQGHDRLEAQPADCAEPAGSELHT